MAATAKTPLPRGDCLTIMAIFKPGPLISSISGTVAGLNFAVSTKVPVIRSLPNRRNMQTSHQLNSRRAFSIAAARWRELSAPDISAWRTAAASRPFKNRFGTPVFHSGWALFLRFFLRRYPEITSAPFLPAAVTVSPPPFDAVFFADIGVGFVLTITRLPLRSTARITWAFSRPISAKVPSVFRNWFLTDSRVELLPTSFRITDADDLPPELATVAPGEIIGLKLFWSVTSAGVTGLPSAPVILWDVAQVY